MLCKLVLGYYETVNLCDLGIISVEFLTDDLNNMARDDAHVANGFLTFRRQIFISYT